MASTDWTSLVTGTVSNTIVADATAPSPPDAMQIDVTASGGQAFQNITGGPFKNSAVSAWCYQAQSNGSQNLMLCLRSLNNTTFEAAPATYFRAQISPVSVGALRVRLEAVVNGVVNFIVQLDPASVNGNPINTWQQFEFGALNSGTNILLRVSQWNGSVFVPILDSAVPIASFPTLDAAGSCRFGTNASINETILIDDVNYYSLT